MKLITILLIFLSFFTACSNEGLTPLNTLVLSNSGVNLLNTKIPYEENIIASKLLGYEIDAFTAWEHAIPVNIMRVHYYNKEVMIITSTRNKQAAQNYIKNIIVTSNFVKNPFGIKIGDVYTKGSFSSCALNNEEIRIFNKAPKEQLTCKQSGFENIEIIFTKKSKDTFVFKEFIWSDNAKN
ncbi:hypothetical protein KKG72_12070 [bacterium]|nr:hypothetical protein [bacterium]MBU1995242.1 hypothetical protein [bacterium]